MPNQSKAEQELIRQIDKILSDMCFDLIGGTRNCPLGLCKTDKSRELCYGLHRFRSAIFSFFKEALPELAKEAGYVRRKFYERFAVIYY